jgi:hypothetical protein
LCQKITSTARRNHELPAFEPSVTQSPKALRAPFGSQKPGLSSSCAYGLPGATPASCKILASLLRSRFPAHLLHWIGLRSGLERTTPTQRSRTEKRVSSAMSMGRLSFASGSFGRRRVLVGAVDAVGWLAKASCEIGIPKTYACARETMPTRLRRLAMKAIVCVCDFMVIVWCCCSWSNSCALHLVTLGRWPQSRAECFRAGLISYATILPLT